MSDIPRSRPLLRVVVVILATVFSVVILPLAFLDYAAVRGHQVGSGWRFATYDEVVSILERCEVVERQVVKAGAFIPFGWAWNIFPEDRGKSDCFDRSLSELGATAVIYDGMG
ncbi:MAG: hypothetical protein EOP63_16705 [Sphingomonadales bacterium]|nr:MAG: hypothetical protein EOP63_16705 [Sphingomonadales bacterium]